MRKSTILKGFLFTCYNFGTVFIYRE